MGFTTEKVSDEDKKNLNFSKLSGGLNGRLITESNLRDWIIDRKKQAYLIFTGRVGPDLPGECYVFVWKENIFKFYCEFDFRLSTDYHLVFESRREHFLHNNKEIVSSFENQDKLVKLISGALAEIKSRPGKEKATVNFKIIENTKEYGHG